MGDIKEDEKKISDLIHTYNNIAMNVESEGTVIPSIEKEFHQAERQYIILLNTVFLCQDDITKALMSGVNEKRDYATQVYLEKGGKPLSPEEEKEIWEEHFYGGRHRASEKHV